MQQDHKHAFWHFTIRYNLLLLGGLYFVILGFAVSDISDRIEDIMNVWKMVLHLLVLVGAFGSWIYCIRKSWLLTNFDHSLRIATMAYLLGAPLVLLSNTQDIISIILQITEIWVPSR